MQHHLFKPLLILPGVLQLVDVILQEACLTPSVHSMEASAAVGLELSAGHVAIVLTAFTDFPPLAALVSVFLTFYWHPNSLYTEQPPNRAAEADEGSTVVQLTCLERASQQSTKVVQQSHSCVKED